MANWDRQYRLRAGIEGGRGFEIGEPDKVSNLAVHISFTIEKSDSTTLNTTKIKLWNLNKEQINVLTQTGCQIDITAGYGTAHPPLCGNLREILQANLQMRWRMRGKRYEQSKNTRLAWRNRI